MLINRLTLKKLLSFRDSTIELGALNVLIGPNAVGKSNLIEVIGLLQSTPNSLTMGIVRGGGIRQWLWLGDPVASPIASVECDLTLDRNGGVESVRYGLDFSEDFGGLVILGERVERLTDSSEPDGEYLNRSGNRATYGQLGQRLTDSRGGREMVLPTGDSILAQFKNPGDTTPITQIGA